MTKNLVASFLTSSVLFANAAIAQPASSPPPAVMTFEQAVAAGIPISKRSCQAGIFGALAASRELLDNNRMVFVQPAPAGDAEAKGNAHIAFRPCLLTLNNYGNN